jgi:branched-chain amino acid transport system substrate-binding protein
MSTLGDASIAVSGSLDYFSVNPEPSLRRRSLISFIVLAFAVVLGSCSRGAVSGAIVLAAAGPWTQGFGAMNKRGIDLAVDEINAAWRGQQRTLRVIQQDDSGSGRVAARIAQGFVDSTEVLAVIGHVNSGAMVAASKVYDGRLAAVATTASSPELSGISPWVFRVISSDSTNGIDLARFASAGLGHRTAAILYENNSYGRGLTESFRQAFAGQVLTYDPIAENGTGLEPHIAWLKRHTPAVVFVPTTDLAGRAFLREARRQGLNADFLGGDGWTGVVVDTVTSEGAYVGSPFTAENPDTAVQHFVRSFRAKYGVTPDHNAALAYDATRLLAAAAEAVGRDRKKIREWLAGLSSKPFRGITGNIAFQPNGDPIGKGFVMTRVHNGAMVLAGTR